MGEVRTDDKGDFFDAIILRLSGSGEIKKMFSITQGGLEMDFHMASKNALVQSSEGTLFFSGNVLGYNTEYRYIYTGDKSYVYRYSFEETTIPCLLSRYGDENA